MKCLLPNPLNPLWQIFSPSILRFIPSLSLSSKLVQTFVSAVHRQNSFSCKVESMCVSSVSCMKSMRKNRMKMSIWKLWTRCRTLCGSEWSSYSTIKLIGQINKLRRSRKRHRPKQPWSSNNRFRKRLNRPQQSSQTKSKKLQNHLPQLRKHGIARSSLPSRQLRPKNNRFKKRGRLLFNHRILMLLWMQDLDLTESIRSKSWLSKLIFCTICFTSNWKRSEGSQLLKSSSDSHKWLSNNNSSNTNKLSINSKCKFLPTLEVVPPLLPLKKHLNNRNQQLKRLHKPKTRTKTRGHSKNKGRKNERKENHSDSCTFI